MERAFKELQPGDVGYRPPQTKASLQERTKYQFEADSEDDEMENEIDSNLDALGHAAGRLHALARATGKEVEAQNKQIDKIIEKAGSPGGLLYLPRLTNSVRRAIAWTSKLL
jgi:hypothetical protein